MSENPPDFVFLDIETMGTQVNTIVLSMAMLAGKWEHANDFDYLLENGSHWVLKAKEQSEKLGRTFDQSTVDWWKKQGEEAREAIFNEPNKISVFDLPNIVRGWNLMNNIGSKTMVWIRAPHFDEPIVKNLFQQLGEAPPINHWKVRDVRTAIDVKFNQTRGYIPGFVDKVKEEYPVVKHNCFHDCIIDAMQLYYVFNGE